MLSMTDAAGAQLTEMLTKSNAPEGVAVRVVVKENSLALGLDNTRPGDETIDHAGKTVLLLDEQISTLLTGRTLDVEETEEGTKLVLT
jgi:Fe-S cluster assembly iron-binding protein IscA